MSEPSARACAESPPPELWRAVEEFNRGEFFACHETLERLWLAERRPVRELYQGILQVGVGFYHLQRGNYRGGLLTLDRGLARLRKLPAHCLGVQVRRLVSDAERTRSEVVARGAHGRLALAERELPRVHFSPEVRLTG